MDGPFLLIVAALLTLSREVQPCTHATSTLYSMRYWLAPRFTGLLLARSWLVLLVTGLLLACSWLVPLVTGPFLACSACYWLVTLVLCFSNVVQKDPNDKGIKIRVLVFWVLLHNLSDLDDLVCTQLNFFNIP